MPLTPEKMENLITQAMESKGYDQKYNIERLIINTSLYSVYLITDTEQSKAKDEILLIEHLPAQAPAAHILPIQIRESASKKETLKEIIEAVDDHFAQEDQPSF